MIGEKEELLIGGGVDIKFITFIHKPFFHLHGKFNGMFADTCIKIVGEKCGKLNTQ